MSNLPDNWKIVTLASICESIDYGFTQSATHIPTGIKFLRITDIVSNIIDWNLVPFCEANLDEFKKYQLNDGDIVIARTGATTGYSAYIKNPPISIFASYLVRFKIQNSIESKFVYYFLKSSKYWAYIKGILGDKSAQPNASAKTISQVSFPLPPLPEQKAIAHILGTLDDKIELNQQMNQTLEAIAKAIFKSWFVDFDPVRAKMEGRQPVGMDAATAELFPDSFEESASGLIPKGWRISTIGESVKVVGGGTPSTKNPEYWENGIIHWTTPKDLSSLQSPVLLNTDRKITELGLTQISSGLLPVGTLLLSSRAPIGYFAISEIPVAINQGYIAMICDKELSNHYVLQWARNNMDVILGRANGTTFLEISKSNFRPIEVITPSFKVLQAFNQKAQSIHQKIVNNLTQSRTLTTIRDTLLPKLMSGEIRVKEAEKLLDAVV